MEELHDQSKTMYQHKKLSISELHERFLSSVSGSVKWHTILARKPMEIDLSYPLPPRIRLYLFNLTSPPGGRTLGEHKIQLITPGQRRGIRGNFDCGDTRIVLLSGYEEHHDVFVFWDASLYKDFPYSMNVQVRAETVYAAFTGKVIHQKRRLHSGPSEIVTATPSHLLSLAIQEHVTFSLDRLLGECET